MKNFEELLEEKLQDLYSAENQILKALPKMEKAAMSPELQEMFKNDQEEVAKQIKRLEDVGVLMNLEVNGKACKGMQGLIAEVTELIKEEEKSIFRDAALIANTQSIEHYEIAGYGAAMAYAKLLGAKEPINILKETIEEEKDSDIALTALAEGLINPEAKADEELTKDSFQGISL